MLFSYSFIAIITMKALLKELGIRTLVLSQERNTSVASEEGERSS
jgi:hypothetical protein